MIHFLSSGLNSVEPNNPKLETQNVLRHDKQQHPLIKLLGCIMDRNINGGYGHHGTSCPSMRHCKPGAPKYTGIGCILT